jgi:glutathione S-transferase
LILLGMFDSPFVRRVAVSMKLLGIAFEHRNWSVGQDFDSIRQFNPLGRVPTLVLDDGEALMESAAILDYLDEQVGPERALIPRSGAPRCTTLRLLAMLTGATEKGIAQVYESIFRPPEKRHEPWLARCRTQMHGSLQELERICAARGPGRWLAADRMTQADVTLACVFGFLAEAPGLDAVTSRYGALRAVAARCEEMPEFSSTRAAYVVPAAQA